MPRIIRNPVEWGFAQLAHAAQSIGEGMRSLHHVQETMHSPAPTVRRIGLADLRLALARGWADFGASRSDVAMLCLVYPVLGFVLAWLAAGNNLLPLLFPLASGFALVGPLAAVGLYAMSRRRERGETVSWLDALDVLRAPAWGAMAVLGLFLIAVFAGWLATAWAIYAATLGPAPPVSLDSFVRDVFTTQAGHMMIAAGIGAGFLFALFVLAIGLVSFPLLLDRDVGLDTAVATSVRAVARNPVPVALWGAIVAVGLMLGSLPLFLGLIVVLPVLGHATWHLYRRLVE